MDKRTLRARIAQLRAADMNALDIYTGLSAKSSDSQARDILLSIAGDEKRHVDICDKIIALIDSV